MSGGLSGGEKKRVQCGVELVTNPEIILLDEPTSGLDSYSAQNLIDVLKKIADAGATVIVTIHQPPPPVVRKIDNLLLLMSGRILYDGPMGKPVEKKFTKKGFPKPDDYNIADWILVRSQMLTVFYKIFYHFLLLRYVCILRRDSETFPFAFLLCTTASISNQFGRRAGRGGIL
jgi:ABC-type multidrug transport system ATPase subunit